MRKKAKIMVLIILALFLILVVVVGIAYLSFSSRISKEIASLLSQPSSGPRSVVTEEMLTNLPQPVQKYMRYTGVLGKPIPHTIRLRQVGRIRQDKKSAWTKLEAVEYYSTNPPGFLWKAYVPNRRFPVAFGRDAYLDGRGSMLIKMLSLIPLAKSAGSETDQGAMMRYLNEMSWFPAAFLGDNISWKPVDETSAGVTLTHGTQSVSAIMLFGPDGRPLNFVAKRYRMVGSRYDLETWSTPFTAQGEFEGLQLPVRGQGVWNLKEGDLVYVELEITRLEYDKTD